MTETLRNKEVTYTCNINGSPTKLIGQQICRYFSAPIKKLFQTIQLLYLLIQLRGQCLGTYLFVLPIILSSNSSLHHLLFPKYFSLFNCFNPSTVSVCYPKNFNTLLQATYTILHQLFLELHRLFPNSF